MATTRQAIVAVINARAAVGTCPAYIRDYLVDVMMADDAKSVSPVGMVEAGISVVDAVDLMIELTKSLGVPKQKG